MDNRTEKLTEFWNKTNKRPLIQHSTGHYFISRRYEAASTLLEKNIKIEPHMIDVSSFRDDYIRLYTEWEKYNTDAYFTAVPFPGIPWMEAILGCDIWSNGNSFIAHKPGSMPVWDNQVQQYYLALESVSLNKIINCAWFDKYIEFTDMLNKLGKGRFPVGQPILRGPVDIVGAVIGQEELVFGFYDRPHEVSRLLNEAADMLLYIADEQRRHIDLFYGGRAMGYYDLWCPDGCLWFQDDLTALLSPEIYQRFAVDIHKRLSMSCPYTLIHLHPVSLYIIDSLLSIRELNAVEINKDVGGPDIEEMMPVFTKVLHSKNLVVWGDFDKREVGMLTSGLEPEGLCIIVYSEH